MKIEDYQDWQPVASFERLHLRAKLLQKTRQFFADRCVLEVDTPVLCQTSVTDPYIISMPVAYQSPGGNSQQTLYLQTSPEYAMKRLLAAGSGSIYQISKAFRQGEEGRWHNPEFTMLEWYRLGFDHHALMDEMDVFLQTIMATQPAERLSYAAMFEQHLSINPHTATVAEVRCCAELHVPSLKFTDLGGNKATKDTWLNLLMTHYLEPRLGKESPVFIYDFPKTQAALAIIRPEEIPLASRFEVYFKGIELANGFHELRDETEQARRFAADLVVRQQHSTSLTAIDGRFLAALAHGLPDCAGVALGFDRLVMLACNADSIQHVLAFPIARA